VCTGAEVVQCYMCAGVVERYTGPEVVLLYTGTGRVKA